MAPLRAAARHGQRCLVAGGRIFMIEPQPGWISSPVYRWLHHEPFDPRAPEWRFESSGPLSSANDALAWIVFRRDRALFEERLSGLALVDYRARTPLVYFLSGGLQPWCLLPGFAYRAARALDTLLLVVSPRFGSFVEVELVRR